MRLLCKAIGCEPLNGPCCIRCGTDLYDATFIQYGRIDPLFRLWWLVRHWMRTASRKVFGKKCEVCGCRYWRGYDNYTCSDACFENWLPF